MFCQRARISVSRVKASSGSASGGKNAVSSASGARRKYAAGLAGGEGGDDYRVAGKGEEAEQSGYGYFQSRFLPGLAGRRRFHDLASVYEAAGQTPQAIAEVGGTTNHEHPAFAGDDTDSGDLRVVEHHPVALRAGGPLQPKTSRRSNGVAQEAQNLSWEVVNATLAARRNPGGWRLSRGYNVCQACLLHISRRRGARMKLTEWAGRPQTHILGLLVSLLAVLAVVGVMVGTLEYTNSRGSVAADRPADGRILLDLAARHCDAPHRSRTGLRPAALALAMAALLLLVSGVWLTPDSDGYWKATAIVTLLALGLPVPAWPGLAD